MIGIDQLVAHRGFPQRYPENSLQGFKAALESGARWLECDVQLSADRIPMILHDADLERTTGLAGKVWEMSADELGAVPIGQLQGETLFMPRLEQVVNLVARHDRVRIFVEAKTESIEMMGHAAVLDAIRPQIARLHRRAILISFDHEFLLAANDLEIRTGWVIKTPGPGAQQKARQLQPEFLFLNRRKLKQIDRLWPGEWRWVAYTTDSVRQAERLVNQGFELIETNDIGGMIEALDSGA